MPLCWNPYLVQTGFAEHRPVKLNVDGDRVGKHRQSTECGQDRTCSCKTPAHTGRKEGGNWRKPMQAMGKTCKLQTERPQAGFEL